MPSAHRSHRRHKFHWSGDSNRNGHLTAAALTSMGTAALALYTGHPLLALTTAPSIYMWELIATPDMDVPTRKAGGGMIRSFWVLYWRPFARNVGHHRSPLSHSLLIGFPARVAYVFAVPTFFLAGYAIASGLGAWANANADAISAAVPILGRVLGGCLIADVVHLLKDGYWNPIEMLFGVGSID